MKEQKNKIAFRTGGLFYNITDETAKTVEVLHRRNGFEYKGVIHIPSTVSYKDSTYTVTGIGESAFFRSLGITAISIPNTVTKIGKSAFNACFNLKEIFIPNSVTHIGEEAFNCCWNIPEITIPDSLIEIGDKAFLSCSMLTEIKIPHSVAKIGEKAFSTGEKLAHISVDCNNPHYDSRGNCNAIIETTTNTLISTCKNTIIPDSVTAIGDGAFYENNVLSGKFTIPNSVTKIGNEAFRACRNLTGFAIPESVTEIGRDAFYNTDWFNRQEEGILYLGNYCLGYKGNKPTGTLQIKEGTRAIAGYAFADCDQLTSVIIPNSVTRILNGAFEGCGGLTGIAIPNSVSIIWRRNIQEMPSTNLFDDSPFGDQNRRKSIFGMSSIDINHCRRRK